MSSNINFTLEDILAEEDDYEVLARGAPTLEEILNDDDDTPPPAVLSAVNISKNAQSQEESSGKTSPPRPVLSGKPSTPTAALAPSVPSSPLPSPSSTLSTAQQHNHSRLHADETHEVVSKPAESAIQHDAEARTTTQQQAINEKPTSTTSNALDEQLRQILSEKDDIELDSDVSIEAMIRSIMLDSAQLDDDLAILSQVQDAEKRLLNVDESKKLLENLEERRKQMELNTSTISISRLDKLSKQLATKRKKIGIPSCIAISTKYIAVGMSHGLVVIFNHFQEIKIVLGTHESVEYGPIYSVDISADSEWLVCGHQDGQVVVWDIQNGSPIRTFAAEFNTPVIYAKFIDNKHNRIFACSLNGIAKVFKLSYVLMMWVADTTEILNGNAGPILAIANLNPGPHPHAIDHYSLTAFCTSKKVAIIAIQQNVKVLYQIARPADIREGCLPYLAWRELMVRETKDGKKKVLDPVLAIAWGPYIKLVNVILGRIKSRPYHFDFITIAEYKTDAEITGFQWVGPATLVMLNAKDELRVFDPFALEEIELKPAKAMEIVYHSKFTNSLGQPEYSFHNSIRCFKGRLYILGIRAVYTAHILTWEERIAALVNKNKWVDALRLALDFYQGRARAVEGLPRDMTQAKQELSLKIEQLLRDYVQVNLSTQTTKDPKHFESVATIAIDYCLCINREDILFEQLLPIFRASQKHGLLLEKLEPFILGDKLTKLPPDVIQALVQYYSSHNMLRRMEQIILHLDISTLDFHQVVKLCSKHYLSSALFYLFIQALNDYVTPMDYLMKALLKQNHLFGTPEQQQLRKAIGYKILVYLSYIFAGKSFPMGNKINPIRLEEVKEEIFVYLQKEKLEDVNEKYPRVCALLHLDTKEFLRVLTIAFDATSSTVRLRRWLDIFIKLMVDTSQEAFSWTERTKNWPFNAKQIGCLFEFIATYFARRAVDISDYILHRILAYLLMSTDGTTFRDREKLLLDILHAGYDPKRLLYNKLLVLAETGKFYKVTEFFYSQQRDFAKVVRCHLLDKDLQKNVFTFIAKLMRDETLTKLEKEAVRNTTLSNLTELIKIDSDLTTQLVSEVFADDSARVVHELNAYPELQFAYLKSLLQQQAKRGKEHVKLDVAIGERLLELMCRFDKDSVKEWLLEWEALYRLDSAINLCEKYGVSNAYCMLLERAGDFTKALDVYIETVQQKLDALLEHCRSLDFAENPSRPVDVEDDARTGGFSMKKYEESVKKALSAAIMMIRRNLSRLESQELKTLWFRLLDTVMKPLGDLEAACKQNTSATHKNDTSAFNNLNERQQYQLRQSYTSLISYVLESMIGHVSMQTILEKLVQDRGDSRFGDFKPIFTMMLDNYASELDILTTARNLLKYDTWKAFSAMVKARRAPYRKLQFQDPDYESSIMEKVYRYRVENYVPMKDSSRLEILHRLERGDFVSSATLAGTDGAPRAAARRELYHKNALQVGNKIPGLLDKDSRFFNSLSPEESEKLMRLLKR